MSAFLQDLRYGARNLRRAPGFVAIVVAVLALGIGANSAVFSVVNAVLLRPLPYADPDRLYRLDEVNPKGQPTGISPADAEIFRRRVRAFEHIGLSHWQNVTLTGPEGPANEYGGKVSSDCFRMLARPPALGRTFRDDEFRAGSPAVVILTHKLWKSRFAGNPGVLGKTLLLNAAPYTIVGVMPEDFFYDQRFALWTPWQFTAGDTSRREDRTPAAIRLRPESPRGRRNRTCLPCSARSRPKTYAKAGASAWPPWRNNSPIAFAPACWCPSAPWPSCC